MGKSMSGWGGVAIGAGLAMAIVGGPALWGASIKLSSVLWAGGIGAALGAANLLLTPRPKTGRESSDLIQTTSTRNLPVPIVFGKARMGGNWIALGSFMRHKDGHDGTPGARVYQLHGYLGLCEGPVQEIGNYSFEGKPLEQVIKDSGFGVDPREKEEASPRITTKTGGADALKDSGKQPAGQTKEAETQWTSPYHKITPHLGTDRQGLPKFIRSAEERARYGFKFDDAVPWRNTAYLAVAVDVEGGPHLAAVTADVKGPDLSIRRKGTFAATNPGDIVNCWHYDGWTEAFYATLTASSSRSAPFGLLKVPREKGAMAHTQPPASVTASVSRAWYLGRHDILLMQDPASPAVFHIGTWGLERNSAAWELAAPDAGYAAAIEADHLDELNGILHTLHRGTACYYVMRWNLLTGRIERLETDCAVSAATVKVFAYVPDLHAYVLGLSTPSVLLLDADSGVTYHATGKIHLGAVKGVCAAGSAIGFISDRAIVYYDPQRRRAWSHGNPAADLSEGALGGIAHAVQNTWTGHVTLVKSIGGTAAYINFIPSVREPGDPDTRSGWVRDWSTRTYNAFDLHALEGDSSVAAAMWNVLVDEPATDSGRWGAGMNRKLFCLSSFESVHAYCVGPVWYTHKAKQQRYQERYKLDLVVDSERSVSQVLASEMLLAINGYRTVIDGRMHIGVQRYALPVSWRLNEEQILADSAQMVFMGRTSGVNRVRVEYVDGGDDFRHSFAEANDEYDANARGRVMSTTLNIAGISRKPHAAHLAQQILDNMASNRRQIVFKVHWLGYALNPGDGIEVTHKGLRLSRLKARVVEIKESEDGELEITAVEQSAVKNRVRATTVKELPEMDELKGCRALEVSAEARQGIVMSPMHAAVVEYANRPRLAPLAALSPKSIAGQAIRVDYRFEDQKAWTSMGKMESCIGGVTYGVNLGSVTDSLPLELIHGDGDEAIEDTVPVVIATHNSLGRQIPRTTTGDEVCEARLWDQTNKVFRVERSAPQSWTCTYTPASYIWNVTDVTEETDECGEAAVYYQALRISDGAAADRWIDAAEIPAFPFYFYNLADATCYYVDNHNPTRTSPGTILQKWQAIETPADVRCAGCSSPPTGSLALTTTITGSKQITLSWNNLAGEHGYRVYRKNYASGTYALVATVAVDAVTYQDSVPNLGDWYYFVEAYNACGSVQSNVDGETVTV